MAAQQPLGLRKHLQGRHHCPCQTMSEEHPRSFLSWVVFSLSRKCTADRCSRYQGVLVTARGQEASQPLI